MGQLTIDFYQPTPNPGCAVTRTQLAAMGITRDKDARAARRIGLTDLTGGAFKPCACEKCSHDARMVGGTDPRSTATWGYNIGQSYMKVCTSCAAKGVRAAALYGYSA
jgi:hypothetical protein